MLDHLNKVLCVSICLMWRWMWWGWGFVWFFLVFFLSIYEKDDVNNDSSMNKYDETGAASICSGHVWTDNKCFQGKTNSDVFGLRRYTFAHSWRSWSSFYVRLGNYSPFFFFSKNYQTLIKKKTSSFSFSFFFTQISGLWMNRWDRRLRNLLDTFQLL